MDDQILTGLDIGTTKVAAVIMQKGDGIAPIVLGVGTAPSYGLKKGFIVNIDSMIDSIAQALEDAQLMAGVEVQRVYCSISGGHITSQNSRGVVAVSNKNREITETELERVIEAAQAINFSKDREILHVIPHEFVIDDQDSIRDPVGMKGVRLEVDAHIVTANTSAIQNIQRTVQRAGFTLEECVLSSLASCESLLFDEEKEGGTLIIDIGGGTTDVLLYMGESVRYSAIFPIGGKHVTHDISIGLKIAENISEKLKLGYGCCLPQLANQDDSIVIPAAPGRDSKKISHVELCEIIIPRVEELIEFVYQDIKAQGLTSLISGGIVLTGGGAMMKGIDELSEKVFNLPARIAYPQNLEGLKDKVASPIYATAVGLCIYGAREYKQNTFMGIPEAKRGIFGRVKHSLSEFAKELFA